MKPVKYIGIDPDTKGAVCVLDYSRDLAKPDRITFIDNPVRKLNNTSNGKNETCLLLNEMARVLVPYRQDSLAMIEQQITFRGDHSGKAIIIEAYGAWQMACTILGIPFVSCMGATWKKHFGFKDGDKEHSLLIARTEFDWIADQFTTHGRADAALQAQFARDNYTKWMSEGRLLNVPLNMAAYVAPVRKTSKRATK